MDELNLPQDTDEALPEGPSKSQIKRELHALQDLAERLVSLPRIELEKLALSEAAGAAIDETARIKDHRALRRHYKRIAKLLAKEDMEVVNALMYEKDRLKQEVAVRHHRVERWRERLIVEGDDALSELVIECPDVDRQQLRTLVRTAQRETARGKPDAARKLFRFLREEFDRMNG